MLNVFHAVFIRIREAKGKQTHSDFVFKPFRGVLHRPFVLANIIVGNISGLREFV